MFPELRRLPPHTILKKLSRVPVAIGSKHHPTTHPVSVSLLTAVTNMPDKKQLEDVRLCSGSQFEGIQSTMGAGHGDWHHSQEAERGRCWCSARFFLFIQSRPPDHGGVNHS